MCKRKERGKKGTGGNQRSAREKRYREKNEVSRSAGKGSRQLSALLQPSNLLFSDFSFLFVFFFVCLQWLNREQQQKYVAFGFLPHLYSRSHPAISTNNIHKPSKISSKKKRSFILFFFRDSVDRRRRSLQKSSERSFLFFNQKLLELAFGPRKHRIFLAADPRGRRRGRRRC